jgi:PAS domain-containing protein
MLWSDMQQSVERAEARLVDPELLALQAALDEVAFGVVLLDAEMRAQFINRAFRRMWNLPDTKADSRPAFVALIYHGRDTHAYDVSPRNMDAYVAERVAQVRAGDSSPRDLRLANGAVVRFQCAMLPAGGRMLSYTIVTDIVRQADELRALTEALENVEEGVLLLDASLTVQFMNCAMRRITRVSDEFARRKPTFAELVDDARSSRRFAAAPDELQSLLSQRIAQVQVGDCTPTDLPMADGRIIRSRCTVLPGGGRMLTYCDVTDLVRAQYPVAAEYPGLPNSASWAGVALSGRHIWVAAPHAFTLPHRLGMVML